MSALVGVFVVGWELWWWIDDRWVGYFGELHVVARAALPLGALVVFRACNQQGFEGLGLRMRPVQGWWYWAKAATIIGLIVATAVGVTAAAIHVAGSTHALIEVPRSWDWRARFLAMVVFAPVVEELTFRFAFCTPLVRMAGVWPTVIATGALFALLHYHNPSPDNLVAGFLLGWAYLRSESILIPIALHAFGNLTVWSVMLAVQLRG